MPQKNQSNFTYRQTDESTYVAPYPIDLSQYQSDTEITVQTGSGEYTKYIYTAPVQQHVAGQWKKISNQLVEDPSTGKYIAENPLFHVELSKRIKDSPYLTYSNGIDTLSFSFIGVRKGEAFFASNDVAAIPQANQLLYQNVVDSVHIRDTVLDSSIKEDIILTQHSGVTAIGFRMESNLTPVKLDVGRISFVNAATEEIFYIPTPYMSDSNYDDQKGEGSVSYNVQLELESNDNGSFLWIQVDHEWLADSARVYPVYIDPTINASVSLDSFVASAYPTTNYNAFWDSASGFYSLKVGYYDSSTGTNYAYLKPDVASLAGATISSAIFNVYTGHSYYVSQATGVWIDAVNANWGQTSITWNNKPSSSNITNTSVYRGQWAKFTVTTTVKNWVSGAKTNYGFKLHNNGNGQTYWKKFYANENSTNKPYLAVTYTYPTPATPTGTPYSNGAGTNSGYVNLSWKKAEGAVRYDVAIFNGKEYQRFNVGNVTSWWTKGKGIWPTAAEIVQGRYLLHLDARGTEFSVDPSPVYRNSGGPYPTTTHYWFRVIAVYASGESALSGAYQPTIPIIVPPLEQLDPPTGIVYNDLSVDMNTGYIDLTWETEERLDVTGYKLAIFNGRTYQEFDIPDREVTSWTSKGKGIWPTASEIAAGGYLLHTDGLGSELAIDPSPVYRNSGGSYPNSTNYWFRIRSYKSTETGPLSDPFTPFLPTREYFFGSPDYLQSIPVPKGQVTAATGNLVLSETDFSFSGRGPAISITRTYNNQSTVNGLFGVGWSSNVEMNLLIRATNVVYRNEEGTLYQYFMRPDETYEPARGIDAELEKLYGESIENVTVNYKLTFTDQTTYYFNASGRLLFIVDANQNTVILTYDTSNKLISVRDASGRLVELTYGTNVKVEKVKGPDQREWMYGYIGSNLTSVTNPKQEITRFAYTGGKLTTWFDPTHTTERPVVTTFNYVNDIVASVQDALSQLTSIAYDIPNKQLTYTEPEGNQVQLEYNVEGNPVKELVDPGGLELLTTYKYEEDRLKASTDANVNSNPILLQSVPYTNEYVYDEKGNLLIEKDTVGTSKYRYDDQNNQIEYIDKMGKPYESIYEETSEVSSSSPVKVNTINRYDEYGNLTQSSKDISSTTNLLKNAGMESASNGSPDFWYLYTWNDNGRISIDSSRKVGGRYSVRVDCQPTSSEWGYLSATQVVVVKPDTLYTVSGWLKTENLQHANAFIQVAQLNENDQDIKWLDNRYAQLTATTDWVKRQFSFITESETKKVLIYLEVDHQNTNAVGSAWFDNIQLESGDVIGTYNPVENSSFEDGLTNWTPATGSGTATVDTNDELTDQYMLYERNVQSDPAIIYKQVIPIYQTSNDVFPITVTGLSKSEGLAEVPRDNDYALEVNVVYQDQSTQTLSEGFTTGTHEWECQAVTIVPSQPILSLEICLVLRGGHVGKVWFDDIRIQRGIIFTKNTYDEIGNYVIRTENPLGYATKSTYNEVGWKLSETDEEDYTTTYTYDKNGNLEEVFPPGYDVRIKYQYDRNGNLIDKYITKKTDENSIYSQHSFQYNENNEQRFETNALNKNTETKYDQNGNMVEIIKPDENRLSYQYDKANRQVGVLWNDVPRFQLTLDPNGNVTRVNDFALVTVKEYSYDLANRLTSTTASNGTINWEYDSNNNNEELTITNQSIIYRHLYRYNSVNQNTIVTDPRDNICRIDYVESGGIGGLVQGNGVSSNYQYNEIDQIQSLTTFTMDGVQLKSTQYSYDSRGNRNKIVNQNNQVTDYTFDSLNQLLSETVPTLQLTYSYEYDGVGNRTKKTVKQMDGTLVEEMSYVYNQGNQLIQVDDQVYMYDDNGQLVNDGERSFEWDIEGHLIKVSKVSDSSLIAEYRYDEKGRRIQKKVNNIVTQFTYDGDSIRLLYETNENNTLTRYYTYSSSGMLLSMTEGTNVYYYHLNEHGDVEHITDQNSMVVASYQYDAYGNHLSESGPLSNINPIRYAGYYYDEETQMYYLMARFYEPQNGSFISPDRYSEAETNLITQNGYCYGNNNPILYTDSYGEYAIEVRLSTKQIGYQIDVLIYMCGGRINTFFANKRMKKEKIKKFMNGLTKIFQKLGIKVSTKTMKYLTNIALLATGNSPGGIIAKGLDYLDGKYDGKINVAWIISGFNSYKYIS